MEYQCNFMGTHLLMNGCQFILSLWCKYYLLLFTSIKQITRKSVPWSEDGGAGDRKTGVQHPALDVLLVNPQEKNYMYNYNYGVLKGELIYQIAYLGNVYVKYCICILLVLFVLLVLLVLPTSST